jgi:thiosulfate/3-mercaptopyruvate sulfurtransferase
MNAARDANLVSTEWLEEHLAAPDIVVVDASWHLPPTGRDGRKEYLAEHIPGARFFDIDDLSDTTSPLPHMLPSAEKFASRMRRMGIGDGKRVIAYDALGMFSAARAWWMFQVMGHAEAAVLDGGLPKWKAEGRPLEDGPPHPSQERHFTARVNTMMVRDLDEVARAAEGGREQIVDARGAPRFTGEAPEPRPGLRSGHIPGSRNLPYADLFNGDGTFKADGDLRSAFEGAGVDLAKPVITSCGSGVTAAILSLGLTVLGHRNHALYDGSWSQWGGVEACDVATGPAD